MVKLIPYIHQNSRKYYKLYIIIFNFRELCLTERVNFISDTLNTPHPSHPTPWPPPPPVTLYPHTPIRETTNSDTEPQYWRSQGFFMTLVWFSSMNHSRVTSNLFSKPRSAYILVFLACLYSLNKRRCRHNYASRVNLMNRCGMCQIHLKYRLTANCPPYT